MLYCAAFDVTASKYSFGTVTFATAGKTNAVVTISAVTSTALDGGAVVPRFWHMADLSAITITSEDTAAAARLGRYSSVSFGIALQTAARAAMTAQSWVTPSDFAISFSATTGLYSWQYGTTFSATWSTTLGRQLCGFSATQSGTLFYQGTVVPYFAIVPTQLAVSDPTPNYEPGGIANHQVTDTGQGAGVERYVSPLCRDWLQQFEIQAKTIRGTEASTHPFTFQHLVEHCRGRYPIMVTSGGFSSNTAREVFSLRTEGTSWHPQEASPNSHVHWHIPFRTMVEGRLAS